MHEQASIVVFRFSAMGDVAMAAAVVRDFCAQYPQITVIFVSRPTYQSFFSGIRGVTFHPIHPGTDHRGGRGLYRLFRELAAYRPLAVADLHHNIRSRILAAFFRLGGIPVQHIDKGRKEKKALTRRKQRILRPLKPTVERYADVFRALGYPEFTLPAKLQKQSRPLPELARRLFADPQSAKIGIAPFAQHAAKTYPPERMETVIAYLTKQGHDVFIFGGGATEQQAAAAWEIRHPGVTSLIGRFPLQQELDIIAHLDLMLTMDSAGMHLASLMGVRVLSVWGGTHPYTGFLGYGQRMEDCIQVDHPNRPSSVYGNKPCICDGKDSMELIEPQLIISRLNALGL